MLRSNLWPKHVRLCGYSSDRVLLFKSSDHTFDLHDNFTCTLFKNLRSPFFLSVTQDDRSWELLNEDDGIWDDTAMRIIEQIIRDDFAYDGVEVEPIRVVGEGWPRSSSAIWELRLFDVED